MTDYVNRQVESSAPSDLQQQRRPDGEKFDDDVAQKEGGWMSKDAVDCQCLKMICSIPSNAEELCPSHIDELSCMQSLATLVPERQASEDQYVTDALQAAIKFLRIADETSCSVISTRCSLSVTYFCAWYDAIVEQKAGQFKLSLSQMGPSRSVTELSHCYCSGCAWL